MPVCPLSIQPTIMKLIPYPRSRPWFSFEQALLSLFLGLVIFAMSLVSFIIGSQVWYAGRIFPGVRVSGIDVGALGPQEAARRISDSVRYPSEGKILLRDGDRIWVATPADMGLSLDPQASARGAYTIGRGGSMIEQISGPFYTWYVGRNTAPSMVLDQRQAYSYLSRVAKEIDKPTVEASLNLKGTDVVVTPGQVGRSVDIPKALLMVSQQIQTLRDGIINLPVNDSPPVVLDASLQAEIARKILSQPLTLTLPADDPNQAGPWTIDQATLAAMLTFERVQMANGAAQYEVRLNQEVLYNYLANLPSLSRDSQNALFIFNDESKQLEVLQPSVTGRELDVENSVKDIQSKLYAGEHTIPMTMKYTDPPVTDKMTGEQLGIGELVHGETSYFYGSAAARVQNIKTAAAKFHGLLVAPGEIFSMVSALGDITLDNGYAEALIIVGDQTIQGVGGGVCQVSTTLFRAAFFAGYPIVERNPHAYRVSYYEKIAGNRINPNFAGLDATVFVPLVDFKFKNDTPNWLLMETYVSEKNSSITWKFYSTADGRKVDWDTTGPTNLVPPPDPKYRENPDLPSGTIKQVDWAAQGSDVTVNRTVTRDGSVIAQDTFFTHYQAWANAFEYGPGTELPTDTPEPGE